MNQNLPPPWMMGAKETNDILMWVVSMGKGELKGLDNLQGGPSVDEETGIREYSRLSEIIEIPEVRDLFVDVANQLKQHGRPSDEIDHAYKQAKDYSLPYRETEEEKHNPLKDLEKKGRGKDIRFAYLPVNLIEFLIEINHVPSVNPSLGILEFGFFDELIRIGGTIAGAILGGPMGAGAGNALAGLLTGKSVKNSVVSGLKTGALSYAGQGLGQAAGLTGSTPYTAGFFGGAPNMLASGLGKLGIGAIPGAAPAAAVPPATAAVAQQVPQASSGLFGTLAGLAPYAAPVAMAGLSYIGHKKHQKHLQRERERQEAKWDRERKKMGWDDDWTPISSKRYEPNPEFWDISEEDIKHGRIHAPYMREVGTSGKYAKGGAVHSYREGTLVKGKGKGQDDFIKTSVPVGAYIWDASTTSMLGDGSSDAGAKVIKNFESYVRSKVPKRVVSVVEKMIKKKSQQAPVYLSNDEYKTDPVTVSLIPYSMGQKIISNEKGADILRSAIKSIRKHKSSAGSGLPPKAKPILAYISAR